MESICISYVEGKCAEVVNWIVGNFVSVATINNHKEIQALTTCMVSDYTNNIMVEPLNEGHQRKYN